jgi:hypothetical protein
MASAKLDKAELSDLKSLIDRKIECQKALWGAGAALEQADRALDSFLHSLMYPIAKEGA